MNFTKKNIKALRDEELPNFNPGEFLQVSDVDSQTLEKYGLEILPEYFRKKKEKNVMMKEDSSRTPNEGVTPA